MRSTGQQSEVANSFAGLTMDAAFDPSWYLDTGASSHMTNNAGNLASLCPSNSNTVTVGNGHVIPVPAIGNASISTPSHVFSLPETLFVPCLSKNLISVRQFTRDNHCFFEFHAWGFLIKDSTTGTILLRCQSDDPLYPLMPSQQLSSSHHALLTTSASYDVWHARLGHPHSTTLRKLQPLISLPPIRKTSSSYCSSCLVSKACDLPFPEHRHFSTSFLELIHCDVWTSPIQSVTGFKYYVLFIDDYSRFCWLYPMHRKSDTLDCFRTFKLHVEKLCSSAIKFFRSDNGGEFISNHFAQYLRDHGIFFQSSCPHTPQQNGVAELCIPFCNQARLTSVKRTVSLLFEAKHPFTIDNIHICSTRNKSPSLILNKGIKFICHCLVPMRVLLGISVSAGFS